jgi:hypothetical protein
VAVVLEHQISVQVHGLSGGLSSASTASSAQRIAIAPPLATAFGNTFWWAVGLAAVALVPALLLPRRPPDRVADPDPDRSVLVE